MAIPGKEGSDSPQLNSETNHSSNPSTSCNNYELRQIFPGFYRLIDHTKHPILTGKPGKYCERYVITVDGHIKKKNPPD